MKIYQVLSGSYSCDVQLTFNDNGVLVKYEVMRPEIESDMGRQKITLPLMEADFLSLMKSCGIVVTEIHREITFDMFWEKYGYKVDKQLAIEAWNKLSADDRVKAYNFIPRYTQQLGNLAKKYPVRYIKHKPWIQ